MKSTRAIVECGFIKKEQMSLVDWYYSPWVALCFFVLMPHFKRRPELIAASYLLASSAYYGLITQPEMHPSVSVQFKAAALVGFLQVSVFVMVTTLARHWMFRVLEVLFWISCAWAILNRLVPDIPHSGLGINTSLGATLNAILLGFALHRKPITASIMALIATVASGTSMGPLAVVIGLGCCYAIKSRKGLVISGTTTLSLILGLYAIYGADLYSLSGRGEVWAMALDYVFKTDSWVFGQGWGTWAYLGPKIQTIMAPNKTTGLFLQLHNDFIQLFFEGGIIGLALWGWAFVAALVKSYKAKDFIGIYMITCFLVSCVGNFPTRLAPTMVCLALMFWRTNRAPSI